MRFAILALAACGSTQPSVVSVAPGAPAVSAVDAGAPSSQFQKIPNGMVGVRLVGADDAPMKTVSADDLLAKESEVKAEVERAGAATEGSPGLYFYGFDSSRIVYFFGRTHWRCKGLGCWDYVAETLYVVPRGHGAEAKLHVDKEIALYEQGDVVKGGMTFAQVEGILGKPARREPLQLFGSERWHYPSRTILFLGGRVAGVEAP